MSYYDNPYLNSFQNSLNPYQSQQRYQQMQQQATPQQVLRINGQNGVEALRLPPNSSVLALDTNNPIVWLITTDGAGYKTPTPYRIEPYVEPKQIEDNDRFLKLEKRIEDLEGAILNGESNPTSIDK